MYSNIIDYVKDHLQKSVNVQQIQTGYFGDFLEINLGRAAVLLEPRTDPKKSMKNTRWKGGSYGIRVWIMVQIVRDYFTSMRELEQLMQPDDPGLTGVISALEDLRADDTFRAMTGTAGGKEWRLAAQVLEIGDVDFGINQVASQRINTAQIELEIIFEIEK